jgi:TPR repeat protein
VLKSRQELTALESLMYAPAKTPSQPRTRQPRRHAALPASAGTACAADSHTGVAGERRPDAPARQFRSPNAAAQPASQRRAEPTQPRKGYSMPRTPTPTPCTSPAQRGSASVHSAPSLAASGRGAMGSVPRKLRHPLAFCCAALLVASFLSGCEQDADEPAAQSTGESAISRALAAHCDELAADPQDPQNPAAGVADADLAAQDAIEACTNATLAQSSQQRLHYQRGRALRAAGRHDEAFQAFKHAADNGYAPAAKAVGDAYLNGQGLPSGEAKSTQAALQWYERAAATGQYPPAVAAAAQLRSTGQPPAGQQTTPQPPQPPTQPQTDPQAAIDRCDQLASDPDDPQRYAKPVPDDELAVGKAIDACAEAVRAERTNARMQYQLGRALWAAARHGEAVQAFVKASDAGYTAAQKAIGDAYKESLGLPPAEASLSATQKATKAADWYRKAIAKGRYPAGTEALNEMGDYIEKNTFDPTKFRNPKYIEVIYTQDFSRLSRDDLMPFLAYGMGMFEEMDSEQVVDHSPQCKPLQDLLGQISLQIGGFAAIAMQVFVTLESSQQSQSPAVDMGLRFLEMIWRFAEQQDMGVRDTYNIVNHYGCQNAIGEQLVTNLGRTPRALLESL